MTRLMLFTVLGTAAFFSTFGAGGTGASFSDAVGASANTFSAASLAAPTSVSTTKPSALSIRLAWTASASAWATGTKVYRSGTSGGPYTLMATITPTSTTSYTESPSAGTYYYVVRSYYTGNGANWLSSYSSQVSATINGPTTATLLVSGDSYVNSGSGNSNYGSSSSLTVDSGWLSTKRALVAFDFTPIPAGSYISASTLTMCFPNFSFNSGRTHDLSLVTSSWSEAGVTWNNQPSVSGTVTASITVPSSGCVSFPVTGDVISWFSGTANNGWRINDHNEGTLFGSGNSYASSEYSDSAKRPSLSVTYVAP